MPIYHADCPDCGEENEFEIEPLVRGRYSGPPENCFPDEGGFAYLEKCADPKCLHEFTDKELEIVYQDWVDENDPDRPEYD